MQWHVHDNLCWRGGDDGSRRSPGVTDAAGNCPAGTVHAGGDNPMVHVWIAPHECGPFAALEGHGAGQAAAADGTRTDQCAHDHGTATATDAASGHAGERRGRPCRTTRPADRPVRHARRHARAAGVRREPRRRHARATCRSGPTRPSPRPPASTRSATARTGHEHYSSGTGSTTTCALDPDHPESLVYEPQPDGTTNARVGDVHAARRRRRSTTCPTTAAR